MADPSKTLAPEELARLDAESSVTETGNVRLQTMPLPPSRPARTLPSMGAPEPIETVDPDRTDRILGRILAGRYQIKRVLGRGGMGIVYEGVHVTVGRPLALKVLRADLARSTEAVARFHREAKAAAAIGSEHIVEVFDFGYTDEGDAYIAMELLEGEDLGRTIRREGPLPEPRAAAIARQVARALESAHVKGIIHRDLKSENVFVVPREGHDFIKLLDFGISKVSEGDEGRGPMTSEGVVMGTPHYMAPEQAISALETDHRIDIYALGCLIYEMLTGRVPFTGKNPVEVVFKHVHETPVPPSTLRPGLSPEFEAVVLKALAKKREDRFATAADMLIALDAARPSLTSHMPAAGSLNPTPTGPHALGALPPASRTVAPPSTPRGMSPQRAVGLVSGTAAIAAGVVWLIGALRQPTSTNGGSRALAQPPVHEAHEVGPGVPSVVVASTAGEQHGAPEPAAVASGAVATGDAAVENAHTIEANGVRHETIVRRERGVVVAHAGGDAGHVAQADPAPGTGTDTPTPTHDPTPTHGTGGADPHGELNDMNSHNPYMTQQRPRP